MTNPPCPLDIRKGSTNETLPERILFGWAFVMIVRFPTSFGCECVWVLKAIFVFCSAKICLCVCGTFGFENYLDRPNAGLAVERQHKVNFHDSNRNLENKMSLVRVAIIGTACRSPEELAKMTKSSYEAMVDEAERIIQDHLGPPDAEELSQAGEESEKSDGMLGDRKANARGWRNVVLVSGGAAWSDQVAVTIYLKRWPNIGGLQLFLPCEMETFVPLLKTRAPLARRFLDKPGENHWQNPGRSANRYHRQFRDKSGCDGLAELFFAIELGASADIPDRKSGFRGFKERNSKLAQSLVRTTLPQTDAPVVHSGLSESSAVGRVKNLVIAFGWSDTNEPRSAGTLDTWKKISSGSAEKVYVPIGALAPPTNL